MAGHPLNLMDVNKMNANIDRALVKALKKVGELLVKHPEGLSISQITGLTLISAPVVRRALSKLGCKENAQQQWELPDEAQPEVFTSTDLNQCSYLAALSPEYVPDDTLDDYLVMVAEMGQEKVDAT